jgi:hypothetical protein
MARTFVYQNKIVLFFALILFLRVTFAYLNKKIDRFIYVEVITHSFIHSNS